MKFLFPFLFLSSFLTAAPLIDKSESKFFPQEFGEKLALFKSFPAFWWNFAVVEGEPEAVCDAMKKTSEFSQVQCKPDPATFLPLIEDWVRDLPARVPPPTPSTFRQKINATLTQLSLPIPKPLFELLRLDPLHSYEELKNHAERRLHLAFPLKQGYFQDERTGRILIPFQVGFAPSEAEKLEPILEHLHNLCTPETHCERLVFFGPHASALENRMQIKKDLERVSYLGTTLLVLSCLFLLFVKKGGLGLLFVPILPATGLAALSILLWNGTIHGLTLAFGPGIIGMLVDYGLQAAFNPTSKYVWKSNTFGYLTTIVCLVVMAFSKIPLLSELMIFSVLGFTYGYLFLYFFRKPLQNLTAQTSHAFSLNYRRSFFIFALFCAGAGVFLLFLVEPKLDLKQFDFQTPETEKTAAWFYKESFKEPPLFEIQGTEELLAGREARKTFSQTSGILLESATHYMPETPDVTRVQWKTLQCGNHPLEKYLTPNETKLFLPFLNKISCSALSSDPAHDPPTYIKHLHQKQNHWLTLWFPKSGTEKTQVQSAFPQARSLGELVAVFPKLLTQELKWMFPISAFLIVFVLMLYYRNIAHALLALFPFLCGMGLILTAIVLFHLPLSFMTLIALIMVMGFSVDCAVFAIDSRLGKLEDSKATASSIAYASAASLIGFFPLLLCSHGILFQLGMSLCLGLLGTAIGAFGGIPGFLR